jgi:hypothetical protein
MRPRPLIKWKSFWLGILVLGFLAFAWVRSMNSGDSLSWCDSRGECIRLGHGAGWLWLFSGSASFFEEGFGFSTGVIVEEETSLVLRPLIFESVPDAWAINVADWFAMLLFLVPWLAFLGWRWNKQKKLTASAFK